jgi:hypothetical protein
MNEEVIDNGEHATSVSRAVENMVHLTPILFRHRRHIDRLDFLREAEHPERKGSHRRSRG